MTTIQHAVERMGPGPLQESKLREHVWPLFFRVLVASRAKGEIYLANHSLGRPLDQTAADLAEGLGLWYERLDEAWEEAGWMEELYRFRERVSTLIGWHGPGSIVPKASVGQGLRAVLNALPGDGSTRQVRVVATRGEFDSVDFVLRVYAEKGRAEVRWVEPSRREGGIDLFAAESVISALQPGVDLVVVSQAMFTTGQLLPDVERVVEAAHSLGALAFVDVYHAAGVVPLDLAKLDADFAAGGSYKYTRGGPGACWLAIHPRCLESLRTLDTGWFAKKSPFRYSRPEPAEYGEGGNSWLESTPAVLQPYQARAGLEFTLAVGVERVRAYSLRQQAVLRREMAARGVPMFAPASPELFGAFSLLPTDDAAGVSRQLKDVGVNTDARGGSVRFGPDILNSDVELAEAARLTGTVLGAR